MASLLPLGLSAHSCNKLGTIRSNLNDRCDATKPQFGPWGLGHGIMVLHYDISIPHTHPLAPSKPALRQAVQVRRP
jgi:hypothetical protein